MSLRDELIQIGAVAVATVTDLDSGSTAMLDEDKLGFSQPHRIALNDVQFERIRQEEKWGTQHHSPLEWLMILMEEVGEAAEEIDYPDEGRDARLLQGIRNVGVAARLWLEEHEWPDRQQQVFDEEAK